MRQLGIGLALVLRIALLFALTWLMGLTKPLFTVLGNELSGRDLVLLGGRPLPHLQGDARAVRTDRALATRRTRAAPTGKPAGSVATVFQILALDIVFSLDSVITAVGMARAIIVMMAAMIIAVGVMFAFAGVVSEFVNRHPSMKILALAFLLLIGVLLTADAFGQHINRGYVYFAMAFSLVIELLNMRLRKKRSRTVAAPTAR